jgi:hypothetical protein
MTPIFNFLIQIFNLLNNKANPYFLALLSFLNQYISQNPIINSNYVYKQKSNTLYINSNIKLTMEASYQKALLSCQALCTIMDIACEPLLWFRYSSSWFVGAGHFGLCLSANDTIFAPCQLPLCPEQSFGPFLSLLYFQFPFWQVPRCTLCDSWRQFLNGHLSESSCKSDITKHLPVRSHSFFCTYFLCDLSTCW